MNEVPLYSGAVGVALILSSQVGSRKARGITLLVTEDPFCFETIWHLATSLSNVFSAGSALPLPAHFTHLLFDQNLNTSLDTASLSTVNRYRGSALTRKRTPLGPYRRPMPRVLRGSWEGGRFLMRGTPVHRLQYRVSATAVYYYRGTSLIRKRRPPLGIS